MTKRDVLEQYGQMPLLFSRYYKYKFWFSGNRIETDGVTTVVDAAIGGDGDDIYRSEVKRDVPISIIADYPSFVHITKGDEIMFSDEWDMEDSMPVEVPSD